MDLKLPSWIRVLEFYQTHVSRPLHINQNENLLLCSMQYWGKEKNFNCNMLWFWFVGCKIWNCKWTEIDCNDRFMEIPLIEGNYTGSFEAISNLQEKSRADIQNIPEYPLQPFLQYIYFRHYNQLTVAIRFFTD